MSGNETVNTPDPAAEATMSPRDQIRQKIFSSKPESRLLQFYGTEVELRQPKLRDIFAMRQKDQSTASYQMLIDYLFVPSTDENVFTQEDLPSLGNLSFNDDMQEFLKAVTEMFGGDPEALELSIKSAEKSPDDGSVEGTDDGSGEGAGEGS